MIIVMRIIAYFIMVFSLVSCSKNDSIVLDCKLNFLYKRDRYISSSFDEVTVVIDRSNQSIIIKNREAMSPPIDGRVCEALTFPYAMSHCLIIEASFKSSNQDWEETANYFKVSGLQVDRRTLQISGTSSAGAYLECIKSDERKI